MLAQLVSVALTASVKATDTKSVSSFKHFLGGHRGGRLPSVHIHIEDNLCAFMC